MPCSCRPKRQGRFRRWKVQLNRCVYPATQVLVLAGVCTPGVVNVLGPGVALDIEFFLKELAAIEQQGLPAPKILISERAQVLMPYHVAPAPSSVCDRRRSRR